MKLSEIQNSTPDEGRLSPWRVRESPIPHDRALGDCSLPGVECAAEDAQRGERPTLRTCCDETTAQREK